MFENLTEIEIFRKFRENSNFFVNFEQNREFSKIWLKSKFFENLTKNWKFSEVLTKFEFFENLTKILENLTKTELFENLTKSKFFENLTKRVIFDQNRYISKFWPKFFEILEHFVQKSKIFRKFSEIWNKIEVFFEIWPSSKLFGNLTEIEIFRKFKFFVNFFRKFD